MTDEEILDQIETWNLANQAMYFKFRREGYSIQTAFFSLLKVGEKVAVNPGVPAHESPKRLRRWDD